MEPIRATAERRRVICPAARATLVGAVSVGWSLWTAWGATTAQGQAVQVVEQVQAFEAVEFEVEAVPVADGALIELGVEAAVVTEVEAAVETPAVAAEGAAADGAAGPFLVERQAEGWAYWDAAEDPGENWAQADFDDTGWKVGQAPLGYGDDHIQTTVSFGGDANQKHLVVFFRRKLTLAADEVPTHGVGAILHDDAAAVYVNGQEVLRRNLPADQPLGIDTTSENAISGEDETRYHDFQFDGKLLHEGDNVVAVRIHQTNATSSDLGFDLQLRAATEAEARALANPQPARVLRAARVLQARAVAANRSFIHLSDGEMTYFDENGIERKQRSDALAQARSYVPGARFVRMMEGDTLARVAARYDTEPEVLATLNRINARRVFGSNDVVCVSWTHDVTQGDTLASLAELYETQVGVIAKLNDLKEDSELLPGTRLQVPGEFSYHHEEHGQSYFRLARYVNVARDIPFDPQSQQVKREQLQAGEDLAAFAARHQVTPEFLRAMNGLDAEADPPAGAWMLVEYSVVLLEDATLEELVPFFNVDVDRMLAVNGLDAADNLPDGRRVQIPIGDRMGQPTASYAATGPLVHSIVLGAVASEPDASEPDASEPDASERGATASPTEATDAAAPELAPGE